MHMRVAAHQLDQLLGQACDAVTICVARPGLKHIVLPLHESLFGKRAIPARKRPLVLRSGGAGCLVRCHVQRARQEMVPASKLLKTHHSIDMADDMLRCG